MMTVREECRLREKLHQLLEFYTKSEIKDPEIIQNLINEIIQAINKTVTSDLNIGSDRIHLEGILNGKDNLTRLKSFVNLLEDETKS